MCVKWKSRPRRGVVTVLPRSLNPDPDVHGRTPPRHLGQYRSTVPAAWTVSHDFALPAGASSSVDDRGEGMTRVGHGEGYRS